MLFNPGDQIKELKIIDYVGSGAFGEVYEAVDVALDRKCAVKFVENKDPTAFKAHIEAQILNQCRHDHVVDVFDVQAINHSGKWYAAIEMEFLKAGSIENALENTFVSPRQAVRWTIEILFGLGHAHANGVLHRDIKPANFMVAGKRAKLSDFGLAKKTGGVPHGSAAGSPVYAAPELFWGGKTTISSDIFSVGVSLFQMLSNFSDWEALNVSDNTIEKGLVVKKVGFPDFVPKKLRRICTRATQLKPSDRYASAQEMRQALEAVHVDLNWIRDKANHWSAEVPGKNHQLFLEPMNGKFEAVYQINGRRKNINCKKFSDMSKAVQFINETIMDTTLR